MQCQWQTSMQCFDPVAITIGSFQIHWYALCYLFAWYLAWQLVMWLDARERPLLKRDQWESLFWWMLVGAVVGARVGYAAFYQPGYFFVHPESLLIPYNFGTGTWHALSGMSFHGGLVGVGVALWIFIQRNGVSFLALADRLACVAPLVSLVGRIGNFLNQELPGRITTREWGMYFPGDLMLRHPVMLYSALLEGFVLFVWMWWWKNKENCDANSKKEEEKESDIE